MKNISIPPPKYPKAVSTPKVKTSNPYVGLDVRAVARALRAKPQYPEEEFKTPDPVDRFKGR